MTLRSSHAGPATQGADDGAADLERSGSAADLGSRRQQAVQSVVDGQVFGAVASLAAQGPLDAVPALQ